MRKHLKFSTHTFARHVQRTLGLAETCTLLARSLERKDDPVFIHEVSGWMREQYPAENVEAGEGDPYFHLVGEDIPAIRLSMAARLLAAPNRMVSIKRGTP